MRHISSLDPQTTRQPIALPTTAELLTGHSNVASSLLSVMCCFLTFGQPVLKGIIRGGQEHMAATLHLGDGNEEPQQFLSFGLVLSAPAHQHIGLIKHQHRGADIIQLPICPCLVPCI